MSEWEPRNFSAYLDAAMTNAGIRNDAELARRSGVNQTQIGNWRSGSARPSMRLLKKVADALDVPANDLYVLVGWLDGAQDDRPNLGTLPPEIRRLIQLYNAMTTDAGRRQIREQIDIVARGLQAKMAEPQPKAEPRSDRRRAS